MKSRFLALGLMTTCAAAALSAQALADPAGRVGRISYVEGEVSFQPPQEQFWTNATRNFPVAAGEAFWTGDQGRAEVQVGSVQARLDNETELDILALDYGETRLSLAQGSIELRLWRAPRGGISISTPAGEVRLDYAGLYRIDVGAPQDDGSYPQVEVTTFDGVAGVPSPQGLVGVEAGQAAMIDPGYMPYAFEAQDAAIDDWSRDREAQERWRPTDDYTPAMTGYEDLGQYGQFTDTPDYGQVWFPRDVPADWAPYRYGHWAYVQPWGWTWIDDQPWGFAPFHYGRWAQVYGRWAWVPGRPAQEPVYAPALVAFIGGAGWSVGFGAGGGGGAAMGWVPLAPQEVYRPTYQVSNTYIRQVNVTNVSQTTINNITVNNTVVNSVTVNQYRNAPAAVVVSAGAFAHGAPVQRAVVPVSAQVIASAPIGTIANRPAPTPEARAGFVARPGGPTSFTPGRAGAAPGVPAAAPPPARLQAIRAAVVAQPVGAVHPPVIAGAVLAPRPQPRPGAAPAFIAPSQIRNPAAQARQPAPVVHAATPLVPAPGASAARPAPLALPPAASSPLKPMPIRPAASSPLALEQAGPRPQGFVPPPPAARSPAYRADSAPAPQGANAPDQARAQVQQQAADQARRQSAERQAAQAQAAPQEQQRLQDMQRPNAQQSAKPKVAPAPPAPAKPNDPEKPRKGPPDHPGDAPKR